MSVISGFGFWSEGSKFFKVQSSESRPAKLIPGVLASLFGRSDHLNMFYDQETQRNALAGSKVSGLGAGLGGCDLQ